ncbi:MAG: helix-turn-helix domain-containing protein [Candidatus Gracilibacteria bacterium]
MPTNLHNVLTQIGLTEKEAKVYFAALEIGTAPASEIALRAKLNRVTTYDTLEKLIKRGFATVQSRKKIQYFSATQPDLVRLDIRKNYMDFKEALPEFRRVQGVTVHPHVRYFEGLDAVKKIYEDTLTAKTEILNYANSKSIRDIWPNYDKEYVEKRVKRRVYLRGLAPKDEHGEKVVKENKKNFREIRLIELARLAKSGHPAGSLTFENEINIYDQKMAIVSFGKTGEIIGMIIESPEIANTQRAIFMMAWEFAGTKKSRRARARTCARAEKPHRKTTQ